MASTPAIKHASRTILITDQDLTRLKTMIESAKSFRNDRPHIDSLEQQLEEAEVVRPGRMPRNVVAIHSRVRITDETTNRQFVCSVVFPREANYSDKISVLAPVGAALLGARVGDIVELTVPGGQKRLRVEAVYAQHDTKAA